MIGLMTDVKPLMVRAAVKVSGSVSLEKASSGYDVYVGVSCVGAVERVGNKWRFYSASGARRGFEKTRKDAVLTLTECYG